MKVIIVFIATVALSIGKTPQLDFFEQLTDSIPPLETEEDSLNFLNDTFKSIDRTFSGIFKEKDSIKAEDLTTKIGNALENLLLSGIDSQPCS